MHAASAGLLTIEIDKRTTHPGSERKLSYFRASGEGLVLRVCDGHELQSGPQTGVDGGNQLNFIYD